MRHYSVAAVLEEMSRDAALAESMGEMQEQVGRALRNPRRLSLVDTPITECV